MPSPDRRLRWPERLHTQSDFRRVFRQGKRFAAGGLALWVQRRGEAPPVYPRLALAISRTYGSAVARNRLKRLLREVFRQNKHRLVRDVDLIFTARPLGKDVSLKRMEQLVFQLWTRAGLLASI